MGFWPNSRSTKTPLNSPTLTPEAPTPRHTLWLYLLLKHVYEHRKNFDDPLSEVEILHADFGYPKDVTPVSVRYMPPTNYDPSTYTRQENIDRLLCSVGKRTCARLKPVLRCKQPKLACLSRRVFCIQKR